MLPERRACVQARPGIIDDRRSSHCRSQMDGPMSAPHAHPVRLTAAQRHRLKKIARGHKRPHRDRLRAQIVLDAAAGHANAAIARRLGVTPDTARKWRGRFASDAFDGLRDRKRSGRPPRFTPVQQAQVKALACELPAASGAPLSRWSAAELAAEAVTAGLVDATSAAPPCVAGYAPTRSNPGSTAPGSPHGHRTLPPAPPSC
jgi:transposase